MRSPLESVLESFGQSQTQLLARLDGLGDEEYLWEPVSGCWTVRSTSGGWQADWATPDPDPAPVTTIAWRLWHISVDAMDSYARRLFGTSGTGLEGRWFVGDATAAIELTKRACETLAGGFLADEGSADRPLGDSWGPHARHSRLDLLLHATRELTHHGAEVALLRDLHLRRSCEPSAAGTGM